MSKWTFQTFSAGGHVENKPEPLYPTGVKANKDEPEESPQTNGDDNMLYPLGFGLNVNEKKPQSTKAETEQEELLLPIGVNP